MFVAAGTASAQFGRSLDANIAGPHTYDARFHYCRAVFRGGGGGGWLTDYPLADIDLSIRLSELTKTPVSFDAVGRPRHLIVRLTAPELYQCPIIIMQEVGRLFFDARDAAALRDAFVQHRGVLRAEAVDFGVRAYLAADTTPEDLVRAARTICHVEGFRTRSPDLVEVFRALTAEGGSS